MCPFTILVKLYSEAMGIFFTSPRRKLSKGEMKKALDKTKGLEKSDRERLQAELERGRAGGISKEDIRDASRRLRHNTSDGVNRTEVRRAAERLLDEMDED